MGQQEGTHSLPELLAKSVQAHASRTALLDPNTSGGYDAWTYTEFWRDIRRVARQLETVGVGPDDLVGLLAESRAWWPITDFAVMGLGAVVVPVYPSLTGPQIEYIVNQSQMSGIFLQDVKQLAKLLELPTDSMPGLRFVVLYEDPEDEHAVDVVGNARQRWQVELFCAWQTAEEAFSEAEWEAHYRNLTRDQLATIVYTSGTTGNPKGTMLTHGNLLSNVEGISAMIALRATDRSLSYLPLSHIFERTAGQFVPFSVGASIAYSRGIQFISEDFQRMPPTVFTTVPRLLEKLQEQVLRQVEQGSARRKRIFERALKAGTAARVDGARVGSWRLSLYDRVVFERIRQATGGHIRLIVTGGAPLPLYVAKFFTAIGLTVVEGYGMTETSPVIAVNRPEAPRLGFAGQVLANVAARIAEDGELLVRGPSISPGYWRDAAATAEAIDADGWLHTGDIGELTDDGYLRITDRKKSLIILSTGKKVVPAAVEAEILKDPFIDQVMIVGQNRKYVSAIVVPNQEVLGDARLEETDREVAAGRDRAQTEAQTAQFAAGGDRAEFLLQRIQADTANLARFEQPKKVIVANEPFTVENGLLTPTLKVRTRDVTKRYEAEIDALYEQD
ncbi:AMP-dependent synthetase/ligase [Alicyclobacillus sp. ALC3]|uniref:AMP-dependent synthetase/ligase n=1 Tax=Alicyclobacillus sp. ALC3 TaxID=2796143 RepID=UPI002378BAB4|nr:long-chain fatty acid--CoA ligase [Alicyclobacillus sp. ALC3]WDL98225.1 long-chain fatty acid--CoA ligase [Alicyclobacillus sp. ALC3]